MSGVLKWQTETQVCQKPVQTANATLFSPATVQDIGYPSSNFMLSAPAVDLTFDDDEWKAPPLFYRAASVGSWGVTSIGRGFHWNNSNSDDQKSPRQQLDSTQCSPCSDLELTPRLSEAAHGRNHHHAFIDTPPIVRPNGLTPPTPISLRMSSATPPAEQSFVASPIQSHSFFPSPSTFAGSVGSFISPTSSPSSPRPRRRSSRQRVSLIAGRVSIAPLEPPSPPPVLPQSLHRKGSSSSLLSIAASTRPPSPEAEKESFLGGRSISDFVIEGEIGRGAYGLVKRAREIHSDGTTGSALVIKQVIKSRILADCWKKHPKHGTIPIEIYVMSAISNTTYVLPPLRPWDPSRRTITSFSTTNSQPDPGTEESADQAWVEGKIVKGHPNICPLLDFFEDNHYYYLVLPSTTPEHQPNQPPPASDLFDLVETFPQGLPAGSVRTYLGQIADALCFLHSQGIVHRDIKDENVVLGRNGKCILIDFGSSGLVKKNGWDTFSGTLDYAGPEILRGERYYGKEQDVWAFGVVAFVLLVGECPFMTAEETQDGLESPFANASIALDERCGEGKETVDEEADRGGALGDAAVLVRACLQVDVSARPTFEKILQSRFLSGEGGWGMED
ncbi:Serine/threonine-protein kinase PSK2 [Hypsizygus marmoreus]|uniref:Serine/threonine-protein kinase PSK2 n=1 Tax=Hypsizygus marmoreus TaxID=39966 RepID=A0A369K7L8_HYPMA|nr:Serine/threonine-protein kinase PSK2 [Hypsizygus marmoreus]